MILLDAAYRVPLARGPRRIGADTVAEFGKSVCEHPKGDNQALRKAYARMLIDGIILNNDVSYIQGGKRTLENAVGQNGNAATTMVPGFDRKMVPYNGQS